jgi:tetratricopeptide (TPR) repeat protein
MGARLYAQLGLFERAKDLFERYLKLEPNAINETFQLGMVHFDAGQTQEAKKLWDDLLEKFPTHPPSMFFRALIMARENEATAAAQLLERLLKSVPADNLYFERAKDLLQTIQTGRAPVAQPKANGARKEATRVAVKDAYKTEH